MVKIHFLRFGIQLNEKEFRSVVVRVKIGPIGIRDNIMLAFEFG